MLTYPLLCTPLRGSTGGVFGGGLAGGGPSDGLAPTGVSRRLFRRCSTVCDTASRMAGVVECWEETK